VAQPRLIWPLWFRRFGINRVSTFLHTSFSIARRICRDAIWAGDRCNWVGPSIESSGVVQKPFGADLYSGTSGVAFFLAALYAQTEERLIRKTAEGAAAHADSLAREITSPSLLGYYSGALGIAWSLIKVGELLSSSKWHERGACLLESITKGDVSNQSTDLMSGYAGAIPALLELAHRYSRPNWAECAKRCGEYLIHLAVRSPEGWSWRTIEVPKKEASRNLTGLSHGVAGIGCALFELGNAACEIHFTQAAQEAFRYERSHYNAQEENWPDFRDYQRLPRVADTPVFATAWCHGAPGIALSRLRAWQLTSDERLREEAEAALRSTTRILQSTEAANMGFSLCHGRGGNADILLEGARILGLRDLRKTAEEVGYDGISRFESKRLPWPCGVPGAGETKNLMLGTAGIGYFYLRLHESAIATVLLTAKLTPQSAVTRSLRVRSALPSLQLRQLSGNSPATRLRDTHSSSVRLWR